MSPTYRFRPRYRGLALGAIGIGALLVVASLVAGTGIRALAMVGGGIGIVLGVVYLISPAWKIVVHVGDDALEVTARGARRFRLLWADVAEVVASPSTKTCFVNGGTPDRSLLVPGAGAPAPYDIEDRAGLFDEIMAHVAKDRIREVELLETKPA
jgi:hypothetical protein